MSIKAMSGINIVDVYDGEPGEQGVSVTNVITQYRLSDSNSSLTGTGAGYDWSDIRPPVGSNQYLWKRNLTYLSNGTTAISNPVYDSTITNIVFDVNRLSNEITSKVSSDEFHNMITQDETIEGIISDVSETKQTTNGIVSRVSSVESTLTTKADNSTVSTLSSNVSEIAQKANKIELITTSAADSSSITLTDKAIDAITRQFRIVGTDGTTTIVEGGKAVLNAITANEIDVENLFAQDITATGIIRGVTLYGTKGEIGGWDIEQNCLYAINQYGTSEVTTVFQNTISGAFSVREINDNILIEQWFTQASGFKLTYVVDEDTYNIAITHNYPYGDGTIDVRLSDVTGKYHDDELIEEGEWVWEDWIDLFGLPIGAEIPDDDPSSTITTTETISFPETGDDITDVCGILTATVSLPSAKAGDTYIFSIIVYDSSNNLITDRTLTFDNTEEDNVTSTELYEQLISGIPRTAVLGIKRKDTDGSVTATFYVDQAGDMNANHIYEGGIILKDKYAAIDHTHTTIPNSVTIDGNIISTGTKSVLQALSGGTDYVQAQFGNSQRIGNFGVSVDGRICIYDQTNTNYVFYSDTAQNVHIPHPIYAPTVKVETSGATNAYFTAKNGDRYGLIGVSNGNNLGIFDNTNSNWVIYSDTNGDVHVPNLFKCKNYGNIERVVIGSEYIDKNRVAQIASYTSSINIWAQWGVAGASCTARSLSVPSSDIRLKSNVANSEIDALSVINQIQMRQFDWKDRQEHWDVGFVADELEQIDPLLSIGGGTDEDGNPMYKSVNDFYLLGYLTKAVQELSAENDLLKTELENIKKENAEIKEILQKLLPKIA